MVFVLLSVLGYVKLATDSRFAITATKFIDGIGISSFPDIFIENIVIWTGLNSFVYLVFYISPMKRFLAKWKFNPMFPPRTLIMKEIARSIRGVAIGSAWEYGISRFRSYGIFPLYYPSFLYPDLGFGQSSGTMLTIAGLFLYLLGDFHFYWTHRMLHSRILYKLVHKYHHESFNPTPFSGLSMHWLESFIYFSYAPVLGIMGVPNWMFRLASKGLIIFPIEGHTGFGSFEDEMSCNHYIHHSKFDWNYGSSPLWDHIMGTNFDMKLNSTSGNQSNTANYSARQQAMLVGCQIGDGLKEPSISSGKTT